MNETAVEWENGGGGSAPLSGMDGPTLNNDMNNLLAAFGLGETETTKQNLSPAAAAINAGRRGLASVNSNQASVRTQIAGVDEKTYNTPLTDRAKGAIQRALDKGNVVALTEIL